MYISFGTFEHLREDAERNCAQNRSSSLTKSSVFSRSHDVLYHRVLRKSHYATYHRNTRGSGMYSDFSRGSRGADRERIASFYTLIQKSNFIVAVCYKCGANVNKKKSTEIKNIFVCCVYTHDTNIFLRLVSIYKCVLSLFLSLSFSIYILYIKLIKGFISSVSLNLGILYTCRIK